jgi:hypothetical protein
MFRSSIILQTVFRFFLSPLPALAHSAVNLHHLSSISDFHQCPWPPPPDTHVAFIATVNSRLFFLPPPQIKLLTTPTLDLIFDVLHRHFMDSITRKKYKMTQQKFLQKFRWKRRFSLYTQRMPYLTQRVRGYIQKFPNWVVNEINNNKHSLRSNTKGYGGKTH